MPYQEILYDCRDGVAALTLNRPAKLNAWTLLMEREVREAMQAAEDDPAVRVILLTGSGRAFCAGADLSLLQALTQGQSPASLDGSTVSAQQYSYFPLLQKPVLAAVNGPAVGLGLVLALYCDLRLAAETATFSTIFAQRGLIAEYGLAWMLPRLIGVSQALDLLYTARQVDANEALQLGLVNRVSPAGSFQEEAWAFAQKLANGVSPRSLRVMKRQVYEGLSQTLPEALASAEREMRASLACEDFKEGIAHFLEKRPPAFKGR